MVRETHASMALTGYRGPSQTGLLAAKDAKP
jgi:hypothetical protein